MATPYDNTDGGKGYSREERRIAEDHGIELDAVQVQCVECLKYVNTDEIENRPWGAQCIDCKAFEESEQRIAQAEAAARFLTAPTLAGCLSLMGVR